MPLVVSCHSQSVVSAWMTVSSIAKLLPELVAHVIAVVVAVDVSELASVFVLEVPVVVRKL